MAWVNSATPHLHQNGVKKKKRHGIEQIFYVKFGVGWRRSKGDYQFIYEQLFLPITLVDKLD